MHNLVAYPKSPLPRGFQQAALPSFQDEEAVKLSPAVFQAVCHNLRVFPTIDLFASHSLRQLDLYYTADPCDICAAGFNALDYYWHDDHLLFVNPPWTLIDAVLRKICTEHSTALLVTPAWTGAPWWPTLQRITQRNFFWKSPLYLDAEGRLRPRPRWTTVLSLVKGRATSLL